MFRRTLALLAVATSALLVGGCGTGTMDSGPTAAGSGAPAASSGAAGAVPSAVGGGGAASVPDAQTSR